MLFKNYTIKLLCVSFFIFSPRFSACQKSVILKNVNSRADELKHNINAFGDSLTLKCEREIYKVEIYNSDYNKDISTASKEVSIALHDIPIGRFVVIVRLKDKLIAITLLRKGHYPNSPEKHKLQPEITNIEDFLKHKTVPKNKQQLPKNSDIAVAENNPQNRKLNKNTDKIDITEPSEIDELPEIAKTELEKKLAEQRKTAERIVYKDKGKKLTKSKKQKNRYTRQSNRPESPDDRRRRTAYLKSDKLKAERLAAKKAISKVSENIKNNSDDDSNSKNTEIIESNNPEKSKNSNKELENRTSITYDESSNTNKETSGISNTEIPIVQSNISENKVSREAKNSSNKYHRKARNISSTELPKSNPTVATKNNFNPEDKTARIIEGYWMVKRSQGQIGITTIRQMTTRNQINFHINYNRKELNTRSGKLNKLTVWEVYDIAEFKRQLAIDPEYTKVKFADCFNLKPLYKTEEK